MSDTFKMSDILACACGHSFDVLICTSQEVSSHSTNISSHFERI